MQTITRVFEGECINKPAERKFVSSIVFETYATGRYNLLDAANSCGITDRIIRYWIEGDREVAVMYEHYKRIHNKNKFSLLSSVCYDSALEMAQPHETNIKIITYGRDANGNKTNEKVRQGIKEHKANPQIVKLVLRNSEHESFEFDQKAKRNLTLEEELDLEFPGTKASTKYDKNPKNDDWKDTTYTVKNDAAFMNNALQPTEGATEPEDNTTADILIEGERYGRMTTIREAEEMEELEAIKSFYQTRFNLIPLSKLLQQREEREKQFNAGKKSPKQSQE